MRQNVGALPLAGFLVLLAILAVQNSPVTPEAPFLLALLNTLFVGIIPLVVAYSASKGYTGESHVSCQLAPLVTMRTLSMEPISVLLVADNPTFLRAAARFLQAHEGVNVVGTANGGHEALAKAQELRPQVILLDLAMPDLPGLQVIPRLRELVPQTGIIALTLLDTGGYRQAALNAGANDSIPKAALNTDLLPAIQRVAQAGQSDASVANTTSPVDSDRASTTWRILVMEDEADLRRLYCKALRSAGYEVYPAATIPEARDLLARHRFDAFMCDIHMGEELGTHLLREEAADLTEKGTVIITVSGESQYRAMCEEMGVGLYLEKPININSLVTLVGRLTARQSYYT
jgi:DNA-binding response OmpR family regulator